MDDELIAFCREMRDRHEITECIRRYAKGMDRNDGGLIESAFHEDALIGFGDDTKTRQQLVDYSVEMGPKRESSQHYVTNHLIELDGDTAHVETYYLSAMKLAEGASAKVPGIEQKAVPADEATVYGGRYIDRFERRNGEWRVATRWSVPEWAIQGEFYFSAFVAAAGDEAGRRNQTDMSYERPLHSPVV